MYLPNITRGVEKFYLVESKECAEYVRLIDDPLVHILDKIYQ